MGIEAVVYKRKSTLATDENLAVTLWFRPDLSAANPSAVLLDGLIDQKGLKISTTNENIFVQINNDIHQFTYSAPISSAAWYGMVFNLNNKYNQISTTVYKLEPGNNLLPNNTTQNSITNVLDETKSITQYSWITTKQYALMPGKIKITNIRMFKKPIESEQRLNILQQYVVRDNQLATIIDNAIPSIQLRRYNQAR